MPADIRRNFPQLGTVEVAHLWRGTLGRAIHRMPQIGAIEPGLWVASGFGGHGLNTTAMAGELIARGIVENDETWRLFAPYELVWAGGLFGRVLAQGLYWGSRPVNSVEAGLARYREQARARKAARIKARGNGKAKPATQQTAALAALAEVVEAEQGGAQGGGAEVPEAEPVFMPPPEEPAVPALPAGAPVEAVTEAPNIRRRSRAQPKPFGRRKRKSRNPNTPPEA